MQHKKLWYKFEKLARDFLENQGFQILSINFTIRWWEIDIIAKKWDVISFVEVKGSSFWNDFQDYITQSKIKALKRTAEHWIYNFDDESIKEYRFDLILIEKDKVVDFIQWFLD